MTSPPKVGIHCDRRRSRRSSFHATPKQRLKAGGPWILERGEGAFLHDADGREYLDALSGGVFAVLAGYGREEIARAMYEQARTLNCTSPYATTSVVTINLARKLAEVTPRGVSTKTGQAQSQAVLIRWGPKRHRHAADSGRPWPA
jgi:adenosylmethionine-8-amino-7-oxononanoate aminotransferase